MHEAQVMLAACNDSLCRMKNIAYKFDQYTFLYIVCDLSVRLIRTRTPFKTGMWKYWKCGGQSAMNMPSYPLVHLMFLLWKAMTMKGECLTFAKLLTQASPYCSLYIIVYVKLLLLRRGMLRSLQPRLARDLDKPILAPLWAAGFSFSKCHAEKKVWWHKIFSYHSSQGDRTGPLRPSPPIHLRWGRVFTIRSVSSVVDTSMIRLMDLLVRYWTRGYDVYTPSKIIFGHDYTEKLASGLPEFIRDPIHTDGNKEPYKVPAGHSTHWTIFISNASFHFRLTQWNGLDTEWRRSIADRSTMTL